MLTPEELENNVQYVLGMTDHYKNDGEILQMLRLKGLEENDVQQVVRAVSYSFNVKRMGQHKRAIRVNLVLSVFFNVIPGITLALNAIGLYIYALNVYLLLITSFRFTWAFIILVPLWLVFAIYSYFKYKRLAEKEEGLDAIGAI